jgi:capsular exopolysaccharide synthesis family protein
MIKMDKFENAINTWYDEESLTSTEFRRLYTKIRHIHPERDIQKLLITSATLGEGKSTISSLLAITMSNYRDTNTLLIDCDLRRPSVHKKFGLPNEEGFVDVILGKRDLRHVLKNTFIPKLKVLTSGVVSKSPAEIFNSPRLRDFFEEIKFYFDTIVVDCSPAMPVSDPLILSSEVDGALLVVRAGKTPRELVKRTSDLLRDAGIQIFGIVLNDAEDVLPYYYSYKYKYYQ